MSLALRSPPDHPSTVSSKHGSNLVHCYLVLREDPQVPIGQHTMPAIRAASWPYSFFTFTTVHPTHLSPLLDIHQRSDETTPATGHNRASTLELSPTLDAALRSQLFVRSFTTSSELTSSIGPPVGPHTRPASMTGLVHSS